MDLHDLYERATGWVETKVQGAVAKLDDPTPCDEWKVRDLVNHMLSAQDWFIGAGRGQREGAGPPPQPPALMGTDPAADYALRRKEMLAVFGDPKVVEQTGPLLGIAFADQLIHGWDLAKATGQDTEMPADLAQAAFSMLEGRLGPDQRGQAFKPEIDAADGASYQDRLLAYTGRPT